MTIRFPALLGLAAVAMIAGFASRTFAAPIEIAEVKHEGPVDFEKEILPIFRRSCLACHNATGGR